MRRTPRGRTSWNLGKVRIIAGRIVSVDADTYTCVVASEMASRRFYDIDIGSDYLNPFDGEGLHVMPEPGAPVWVCIPSEKGMSGFILRYRGYPSRAVTDNSESGKPNMRTNRPRLSPGDISFTTRDRNGIRIRRGRLTEIFGSPLARTTYLGSSGTIHSIAKNLRLDAFGGSLQWKVERPEKDPDGHQAISFDARIKEFSDDQAHVVQIQAGAQLEVPAEDSTNPDTGGTVGAAPESAELVSSPVLRFRVFADGNQQELELEDVLSFGVDKSGQLELAQKGQLNVEIRGDKNVTLRLKPDGHVELEADADVSVQVGKSQQVLVSAGGDTQAVVLGEDFMSALDSWMKAVTTFLAGMAADTTMSPGCAAAATALQVAHQTFATKVASSVAAKAPFLSKVTETE